MLDLSLWQWNQKMRAKFSRNGRYLTYGRSIQRPLNNEYTRCCHSWHSQSFVAHELPLEGNKTGPQFPFGKGPPLDVFQGPDTGGTGGNGCPKEDAIGFKSALLPHRSTLGELVTWWLRKLGSSSHHQVTKNENHRPGRALLPTLRIVQHCIPGWLIGLLFSLAFSNPSPDSPSAGTMHRAMALFPLWRRG